MTTQFIDIAGQRMAVLPAADFEWLVEQAEDREDELLSDRAIARRETGEEYVPVEMFDRILEGENALRVWREYRGLSQAELARMVNCRAPTISELESDKALGKPKLWRALAEALNIGVDDILPIE